VIAGDDGVIADRLSVALGRTDAGREMLEKTVQIPLSIPRANPDQLRAHFLRRLKATLDPSAISVRPDAEARFSEMYLQGLQPRLKTPRTAKRFINALAFALSMLKSRVNTVDLIVVEGIRLLYPNLYRSMRENRDDFLWYRISRDGPDADNRANELLHQSGAGLKIAEQEAVQFLVRSLFPAFDRSRYPSRGDIERWSDDKRICSPEHFDRFFDYDSA
jgi:predicted KAP-like P-loop ATPase